MNENIFSLIKKSKALSDEINEGKLLRERKKAMQDEYSQMYIDYSVDGDYSLISKMEKLMRNYKKIHGESFPMRKIEHQAKEEIEELKQKQNKSRGFKM